MSAIPEFGAARTAKITVLVDNLADLLLESTDTIKRVNDKPLLAEHGFSALLELNEGQTTILWDAGISRIALLENLKRLKIDPQRIDLIALSHGHGDHTGSIGEILRALDLKVEEKNWPAETPVSELGQAAKPPRLPLVAHPAAFRERWGRRKDGSRVGPFMPAPYQEWEALGAELRLSEQPTRLGPGCWTTGYVPRASFEKSGRMPGKMFYREGEALLPDDIEDDQAIILNVENKGLVVLAGCAHAGIVNTVNYARQISGVEKIHAILGGFHLAHARDEERMQTVAEIQAFAPALLVPTHCSGFKAQMEFAARMPQAFVQGAVGTTYLF